MTIIERPDSTTRIIEIPFHIIKSQEEYNNVMAGYTEDDINIAMKMINSVSYQPQMAFGLPVDKNQKKRSLLTGYYWYIVDLELTVS